VRRTVHRLAGVSGLLGALALGSLGGAAESPAADACIAPADGPEVCLQVSHAPSGVSVSSPDVPRYVVLNASVTNEASSSATHVSVEIAPIHGALGAGFALASDPSPSVGSCSYAAGSLTLKCAFGKLASHASAGVDVVLRTPTAPGTASIDVQTSVDEGPSDTSPNPGKVDTVAVTESIEVSADTTMASTYVPANTGVELSVAEAGRKDALSLPPQAFATTAELGFTSTDDVPFKCPARFVCRVGADWLTATIPGRFDPLAEFDFFWPASQVSSKQTERNFVLFYAASPGAGLEIISARCDATLSLVPCLKDIELPKKGPLKGTLSATLVTDHNGRMY
jgi:hypothetical protein